jgi:hypothetical protein
MVFFISFITTLAIYQIVKHIFYYRNSKSYSGEVKQKVQNTISQITTINSIKLMENTKKSQSLCQQVTVILRKLGFKYEKTEDDLRFVYEGINMLIMFTPDDNYLGILVPGILDVNEENELSVLQVVEKINNQLKYVKAFLPHRNSLWLSYERQLYTNEIIREDLIEAMITALSNAYLSVSYFLNDNKDSENG